MPVILSPDPLLFLSSFHSFLHLLRLALSFLVEFLLFCVIFIEALICIGGGGRLVGKRSGSFFCLLRSEKTRSP